MGAQAAKQKQFGSLPRGRAEEFPLVSEEEREEEGGMNRKKIPISATEDLTYMHVRKLGERVRVKAFRCVSEHTSRLARQGHQRD